MVVPTQKNLTQPFSIKGILYKPKFFKDAFYRALEISKDESLELYLKRKNLVFSLLILS